jgi:hypothetical protein
MLIVGAIALVVGVSVLAYSAHQYRKTQARLDASLRLLEEAGRELESTRRLALEVDQWALDQARR